MKRKSLMLMMALALTLLMSGVGQADVLLVGGKLTVGIDPSGGMVSLPGGFNQGITFTGVGATLPNDYTLPGTPWEFYSIGVGGVPAAYGVPGFASNPGALNTVNNSAGTTLQADTAGPAFVHPSGASLIYRQTIVYDTTSNIINVSADIFNNNPFPLCDVVYARGMDPDQDVFSGGGFPTFNTFLAANKVQAVGPSTGMYVILNDLTGGGIASISDSTPVLPWETNPYVLLGGGLVNGALAGNPFDYTINMAWLIGCLDPFTSYEIDFEYQFGVVPVPPSLILLGSGLLGLVGLHFRKNRA